MRMDRQYNGMLIAIQVIETLYPLVAKEIRKGSCDCRTRGYIGSGGEIWLICPFHTGYTRAIKDMEIDEYHQGQVEA